MTLTNKQSKLLEFVKQQHGDQKRKYTGEPYWTHPLSVAELVSQYDKTKGLIEIALCHDLIEDTEVNSMTLFHKLEDLGYDGSIIKTIVNGVMQLTDEFTSQKYPDLNREARKSREAERIASTGKLAQTVKYADIIDNTKSIAKYDKQFAKVYFAEIEKYFDLIKKGNKELYDLCNITLIRGNFLLKEPA